MTGMRVRASSGVIAALLISALFIACGRSSGEIYEIPAIQPGKILKDEYLGLFYLDNKIGYFHGSGTEAAIGGEPVYHLSGDAVIRLDMEGDRIYTILKEEVVLDSDYTCRYFSYTQKIADSQKTVRMMRRGKKFLIRTTTGGKSTEETVTDPFVPLSAAGFILWKEGIQEGRKHRFRVFVEALDKMEDLTITVGRKQQEAGQTVYPLRQKLGNIEITSLVLENGETFKEESIQGFTMKKLTREEAIRFDDSRTSYYDIFSHTMIPVSGRVDISGSRLTMEISGIGEGVRVPSGPYQSVVKKEGKSEVIVSRLPLTTEKTVVDKASLLAATAKIQKDASPIKDLAASITAGAGGDEERVKRIVHWVNKNIKKRLRDKSSALEVLNAGEGECEAHAMLAAALFRSAGIPASVVGGVVYSREHGGFVYHAWNEVLIQGQLMPVDPTFGEIPANPSHLKLTGEKNMEDVILFLGKLRIAVVKSS